jgi:hypothetical protein
MIARATAAMAPISTSLRGPIIKYGGSCLTEPIKTFLEKEPLFSSIDLYNDVEEQRLNNLG